MSSRKNAVDKVALKPQNSSKQQYDTVSINEDDEASSTRPPFVDHPGSQRAYMRDAILGVNDGLVSMFLLIVGLHGGGLAVDDILLAGVTGGVAGAISMAFGEYLATKSQNEVFKGNIKLERVHFKHYREQELQQLRDELSGKLKLKGDLLEQCVRSIGDDDEALLNFMLAFEFGFSEDDDRSAWVAMLWSGALFMSGSLPSVVPWAFVTQEEADRAMLISVVLVVLALFSVGAAKTYVTRGNVFIAGLENLAVGVFGGIISHYIGEWYGLSHPHNPIAANICNCTGGGV
jgi:VIT1/CCC1 family predicted Fe2+/Mn2+ transporter